MAILRENASSLGPRAVIGQPTGTAPQPRPERRVAPQPPFDYLSRLRPRSLRL